MGTLEHGDMATWEHGGMGTRGHGSRTLPLVNESLTVPSATHSEHLAGCRGSVLVCRHHLH